MIQTLCDRCGKVIATGEAARVVLDVSRPYASLPAGSTPAGTTNRYDLCPSCTDAAIAGVLAAVAPVTP